MSRERIINLSKWGMSAAIVLVLALSVRAGVTVFTFTCDPIPYGTNYNLYVITTNGMVAVYDYVLTNYQGISDYINIGSYVPQSYMAFTGSVHNVQT